MKRLLQQIAAVALLMTPSLAQQTLQFRSHDFELGYFYEVRRDESHSYLFVYKGRANVPGKPVFESPVNIYSAFHSPDGKFLVVNHGSGSYGNVSVVFRTEGLSITPYLSEADYRRILDEGIRTLYPQFQDGHLYHIYAPIRDIHNGEALLYAGGDFEFAVTGKDHQRPFKDLFLALDLEKRTLKQVGEGQALKSWYRGLPEQEARYGSGFFVSEQRILTNARVIRGAKRVAVALGNKETWGNVVATSEVFDLALLAIPENSLVGMPVRVTPDQLTLDQKIRVYGYPLPLVRGYSIKVTEGTKSGLLGLNDDPANVQITAPLQPGSSGAPIFDEKNHLVGVACAGLDKTEIARETGALSENISLGIHPDVVRRFLEENSIGVAPNLNAHASFDPEKSSVQIIALE